MSDEVPPPKKIKLTYFDIEGSGEPVRLALALAKVDFTDERLKFGDWPALKPTTPYGQVPVIEGLVPSSNGQPKAQSGAMMRYIGTKLSTTLYPSEKLYEVEEAVALVDDMKNSWDPCLYMGMAPQKFGHPKDLAKSNPEMVKQVRIGWIETEMPKYMQYLEGLLNQNEGQYLASVDQPTIADCMAVVFLRSFTRGHVDHVPTDTLEKYPKIVDYVKRFCALPEIKGRYTTGLY